MSRLALAVSALIAQAARTNRGRNVLSAIGLRVLRGVEWVERHEVDPIPPGERSGKHGSAWVARHVRELDE